MLKIIGPGAYSFDGPRSYQVKVSSRGLIGADRSEFLKIASHEFVDAMDSLQLHRDEVPLFTPAIGATEDYGPNRNGDGFKEATCERTHPTFVKYARFYRDHINKDPSKSYGRVIKSAYNSPMKRVELLIGLNATEKVAKFNRGLVADKEMEKLASGSDLPVSMSCTIPWDVCSGCGNQARTRAEYCDDALCKYGGLKHNMAKVAADGHILHADNPDPRFFDLSHVYRPADRIAVAFGRLEKAASAGVMGGAELAEQCGLNLPLDLLLESAPAGSFEQLKIAHQLAELDRDSVTVSPAVAMAAETQLKQLPGESAGEWQIKQALHALAKQKILLSPVQFLTLATGDSKLASDSAAALRSRLPGIFDRLLASPGINEKLASNPFRPHNSAHAVMQRWALAHRADLSFEPECAQRRTKLAGIRSRVTLTPTRRDETVVKAASYDENAETLARSYAMYQLAALEAIAPCCFNFPEFAASSIQQHHVS